MERSLQVVFRASFERYAETHRLPSHLKKAGYAFMRCRTAALGGHIQACPEGHVEGVWYNSCKHRSCPQCNHIQIERWLEFQQARLLACPHRHLIFTPPHELNDLWCCSSAVMSDLLFQAVRDTLMESSGDERYLGALPGFMCALHTWGRSLALHPHLHCLITEGGLDAAGHWQDPKRSDFLPAQVVMLKFRGKWARRWRRGGCVSGLAELLYPPHGECGGDWLRGVRAAAAPGPAYPPAPARSAPRPGAQRRAGS